MIDYTIPKGFCKKLFDENQVLKHLFPSYICIDGKLKMDASEERSTSINFTYGESPFKELGLDDNVIIDTTAVYQVLNKGRQKIMYLRVLDNGDLVFIKNEDNVLLEYKIGELANNRNLDRLNKLNECLKRVEYTPFNQLCESEYESLIKGKVTYIRCKDNDIVVHNKLFGGLLNKATLYRKYSEPYKIFTSEQNYEELFNVLFMAEFENGLQVFFMFEASAF